jgi:hypothetical protein
LFELRLLLSIVNIFSIRVLVDSDEVVILSLIHSGTNLSEARAQVWNAVMDS